MSQQLIRHGILDNGGERPILTFFTEASTNTFDPNFSVSSGTLEVRTGDGSIYNANNFFHTYSAVGNKLVKVFPGTTSGADSVESIQLNADNLVGSLNLSRISNQGSTFNVNSNPKLTQILHSTSSQNFSSYTANNCDLTGTLDLSGLTGLGSIFEIYENSNLTQIINPVSSRVFSSYYAHSCNLTGTLDVSGLTGLGSRFYAMINPNLTSILNPVSSELFTQYHVYDCDLTGTLDLTGLSRLGGSFRVNGNSNLTQILNPVSSETFSTYYAYNCNLTSANDWFLPSEDEMLLIKTNLYDQGIGNFESGFFYWTSTEQSSASARGVVMTISSALTYGKDNTGGRVRPIRTFIDSAGAYDIGDEGPSSGWIFYIDGGTTYYETAPEDAGVSQQWSDIISTLIGTTSSAVGSGQSNTNDIINQGASLGAAVLSDEHISTPLDLSGLTGLGGQLYIQGNNNLTSILNPVSSEIFSSYYAFNCNLTGTLDVSGLSRLGGNFRVKNNPNLTQILNPVSSQTFNTYWVDDCSLSGELDLSTLTNLRTEFTADNNTNLTSIVLPPLFDEYSIFSVFNCSLNQTTVDNILSKFNTYYSSNSPTQQLTLNLGSGTNASPTGGATNSDIVNLISIFSGAGQTLNLTYN